MKKDKIYALIRGHGRFPVDMLRYDNCSPALESDSYAIINTFNDWSDYEIIVKKMVPRGYSDKFTVGRWESFGCTLEIVDSPYPTWSPFRPNRCVS